MDSSDNHRSNIPVAVSIASGSEPVDCNGTLTDTSDGGFILEFGTPSGKYVITHNERTTTLDVTGELCYTLDFSVGGAFKIRAPFGDLDISLVPVKHTVERNAEGVTLDLAYKLESGDDAVHAVKTIARYLK